MPRTVWYEPQLHVHTRGTHISHCVYTSLSLVCVHAFASISSSSSTRESTVVYHNAVAHPPFVAHWSTVLWLLLTDNQRVGGSSLPST